MTYHTLAYFDDVQDQWSIEFGDYELATVEAERDDMIDRDMPLSSFRIVTTNSEEQAEVDAAIAALPKLKAFTFEAADYIPRGVHVTIYAIDAAAAMVEANRIVEEDEINWSEQESWDDGCTSTQITGLWEGEESYGDVECRPKEDAIRIEMAIAKEIAPAALEAVKSIQAQAKAYNDDLNARDVVPTADHYNALLGIIMGDSN